MTSTHNLTPAYLDDAAVSDLVAMTAPQLCRLQTMLAEEATLLKARADVLQAAIELRYLDRAKDQLRAKSLDTGTAHVVDNGLDVVVTIPKSVSWDQDGLLAELDRMAQEDARHYADFSVKVSETKLKAAPPAIHRRLVNHRTLKPGKPKFEFKAAKKEAA